MAEKGSAAKKPAAKKPAGQAMQRPVKKPAPKKPEVKKPSEKKQALKKPAARKPESQAKQRPVKQPTPQKKKRVQLTTAEWRKIRLEYVKGKTTLRALAEKWNISESNIRKRASNEGWKKRKHKLDTKVEQKVLERVCDARAQEFATIAKINDDLGLVLDNMLDFIRQQPPRKYEDLRGIESLSKAINQVVQTKRDLYNMPTETDKAKIEAMREKNRLEREKWQEEIAEKAASKAQAAGTVWKISVEGEDAEDPIDE